MKIKYLYEKPFAIKSLVLISVLCIITSAGTTIYNTIALKQVQNRIYIKEPGQKIQSAFLSESTNLIGRKHDYYAHCKNGIELTFELEEGDFENGRFDEGLIYFGECGKYIYKKINELSIPTLLSSYNVRTKVQNFNIQWRDTLQEPYSGVLSFDWKIIDKDQIIDYTIQGEFIIYDVKQWEKNRLGAKIENFIPVLLKTEEK